MANIRGSGRNDALRGTASADTIDGAAGNDTIDGGGGADRLTGGRGADVFLYTGAIGGLSSPAKPDVITDFSAAQGDRISFSAVLLTGTGHPETLIWSGAVAAPWGVWQVGSVLNADTTGDGIADFAVALQNNARLGPQDLLGVALPPPPAPTFHTVLADDFAGGYKVANWGNPFDGGLYWNGAWSWSGADVAVRDGELQVTMTRHADGSWTGGGFNSFKAGNTITYGTVEFDARVEEAQGTMTAILMWPASDRWPQDGEIDILETPAQDVMHTLHWDGGGGTDAYGAVRNQAYDETQWHHYKMTWLPDELRIEVDGVLRAKWTEHVPTTAMGFGAMGFVGSAGDTWMGGAPDGSTPGVVTVHIDNVVMAQWDGIGG